MAQAKYGTIITELKGSIGGNTFQRNGYTTIVKTRRGPKRATTVSQNTIHNLLSLLTRRWATLTVAQQQAWRDFAAAHPVDDPFGQPKVLLGINWYVKINGYYYHLNGSFLDVPPAYIPPHNLPAITFINEGGIIKMQFAESWNFVSDPVEFFATFPTQRSTFGQKAGFKLIKFLKTGESSVVNIALFYYQKYGINLPSPGGSQKVNVLFKVRAINRDTGIQGTYTNLIYTNTDY
jgi:hypothetical protein